MQRNRSGHAEVSLANRSSIIDCHPDSRVLKSLEERERERVIYQSGTLFDREMSSQAPGREIKGLEGDVESGPLPVVVKQRVIDRNVKIVLAVLFYFGASMALVLLNKRMFSTLGKEFPLFVTWWQFVVALGMIYIGGHIGKQYPQVRGSNKRGGEKTLTPTTKLSSSSSHRLSSNETWQLALHQ